jgi:16S rRNA (adenine(1408)-N(1))-methyltransferase
LSESDFSQLIDPYRPNISIDLGTGDGLFVYHSARNDASRFYIGVDPNIKPLEKISEKIHKNSKKGGVSNAIYLRSSLEDLPEELTGIANQVFILLPWGSLLRAVLGERKTLEQIRRACAPNADLKVILALEFTKDRSELERLGIEAFSIEELEQKLIPAYRAAGFEMRLDVLADSSGIPTTWARRLTQNKERKFFRLTAHPFSS